MNILDYRMIILGNEGSIEKYSFNFGMHQDCLDDFSKNNFYEYSNSNYIVSKGNGLFYNCGNEMLVVMLPFELNDVQLYSLDYIETWLDNVSYMEVKIGEGKNKREYIFEDDIRNNFSKEVIQYYYNNTKFKSR